MSLSYSVYKFRVVYLLKHFYYSWETVKNVALLYLISVNSADRQIYPTFESFSEIGSSWLSPSNFCYIHSFFSTKDWRKGETLFLFLSVSVQNLDEVSGLADKEGWIKIIDFLKFATDTELCKIEFQDRVFSKSNFGHDEEKKKEGKKEPKLKVFAFFILGSF